MLIAGEGVADKDGIVCSGREGAIGFIGDFEAGQAMARRQDERRGQANAAAEAEAFIYGMVWCRSHGHALGGLRGNVIRV